MIPAWGGLLKAISDVPFVPLPASARLTVLARSTGKEQEFQFGESQQSQ